MRSRGGEGIGEAPGDAVAGRFHIMAGGGDCDGARAEAVAREGVPQRARGCTGCERGTRTIPLARWLRGRLTTSVAREVGGRALRSRRACAVRENSANLAPLQTRVSGGADADTFADAPADADAAAHSAVRAPSRRRQTSPRTACVTLKKRAMAAQQPSQFRQVAERRRRWLLREGGRKFRATASLSRPPARAGIRGASGRVPLRSRPRPTGPPDLAAVFADAQFCPGGRVRILRGRPVTT